MKISRAAYAEMYGPTTGDRVRLADTDLIVEVERDLTVYGEEVKSNEVEILLLQPEVDRLHHVSRFSQCVLFVFIELGFYSLSFFSDCHDLSQS